MNNNPEATFSDVISSLIAKGKLTPAPLVTPKERDVVSLLNDLLSPHFEIFSEVRGSHFSGKKMRLDMVIRPRDLDRWANKNVAFGVEIKKDWRNTGHYCKHVAQSADYANSTFDRFGSLFVLAFPAPLTGNPTVDAMVARIAGRLGVGFIHADLAFNDQKTISIKVNDHTIWAHPQGVVEGKIWKLERRFGSR